MFYLITSFILLAVSIYVGIQIAHVDNYMVISYDHWVVESSLWVALLAVLLLFLLLHFLLRFISKSSRVAKSYQIWRRGRRQRKARALTQQGLCQLAEAHWKKAEQTLVRAARITSKSLVDYLGAATAANAQHAFDRRDDYLHRAHDSDKQAGIAIGLVQAQLQMESRQWEQALSTLQHLNQLAPRHRHVVKLLLQVNVKLKQWEAAHKLLPFVKKYKVIPEKEYVSQERMINFSRLSELASKENSDASALGAFWKTLPPCQQDEAATIVYLRGLLRLNQDNLAFHVVVAFLKHTWSRKIALLFLDIDMPAAKLLAAAEEWLRRSPWDNILFLCLGELCYREKLWGKARDYLMKSIEDQPSARAYHLLGGVYNVLDDARLSQNYYRDALLISDTVA